MARRELVLAGDIGGTKTNLALFSVHGESIRPEWTQSFASKRYAGLVPVLQEFLAAGSTHTIDAACFGIAGPVVDGKVKTPNLPWMIDSGELRGALKLDSLALLNDLEAAAYGIFTLEDDEFCTLNQGEPRHSGNKALIAAGTGLGEAILHDDGHRFHPLASEGGHADFAPRDDLEIELLRYLMSQFGHASYERALSGPGLFNIYSFLKERRGFAEPKWLADRLAAENDPSAVVSTAALANEAEICIKALDLFVSIYGAEAGNLALKCLALGGVFIGGGIAPKILPALQQGGFMRAFLDKGRFAELLGSMTVCVALNPQAPLWGAAQFALRL